MFEVGSAVARLKSDITDFKKGLTNAKSSAEDLGSTMRSVGEGIADFGKQAAVFTGLAAAAVGLVGKTALQTAGDLEQSKLGFQALLGSAEKAADVVARIKKEAAATPFEIKGLTDGTLALTAITKDGNKAIDILLDVGKAVATSGKGQAELDRVVLNLQQISATGKVTAMDIRQFQSSIPIFNDVLKASNLTIDQLENSKDAANLLFGAFKKAAGAGGIAANGFAVQAGALNQLLSNLKDSMTIFLSEFVQQTGIFDAFKQGLSTIIPILSSLGQQFIDFVNALKGNEQVQAAIQQLVAVFSVLSAWIGENQALVMTFLQGLAIGIGALLVIGSITILLTALLNPLTLVVFGVAALYTAWQTNFLGIQTVTQGFMDWINNVFMPAFEVFAGWFTERWDTIQLIVKGTWDIIVGIITLAWNVITGIITVALDLISGNWQHAGKTVLDMQQKFSQDLSNIFKGILEFLVGWGGTLFHNLVKPFEDAWGKIQDLANKIKGAMDPNQRHSPSLVDRVQKGVRDLNDAWGGLTLTPSIMRSQVAPMTGGGGVAAMAPVGGGVSLYINLDGAMITDDASAQRMAMRVGDLVIKKLNANIRY